MIELHAFKPLSRRKDKDGWMDGWMEGTSTVFGEIGKETQDHNQTAKISLDGDETSSRSPLVW